MGCSEKQKPVHVQVLAKLLKDLLLGGLGEQRLQRGPVLG